MCASPWLRWGAVLALVALLVWVALRWELLSLLDPTQLAERFETFGIWGPLVLIAAMAFAVVASPVPSLPLDIAAGLAFGPWLGTLYAATGAVLGAMLSFGLARWLGRDLIERFLSGHIHFCSECSDKLLMRVVLVSRLVPAISFDVVSYGAGLTKMTLRSFTLATAIGTLPLTFLYVSSGAFLMLGTTTTLLLGVVLVALFFLVPRWIEGHDFLGLRDAFRHGGGPDS